MASKRPADLDDTTVSTYHPPTTRLRSQKDFSRGRPINFELGDVVVSLGSETIRLRKKELRARSGYFAMFPENEFPERFVLVPGINIDQMCCWVISPELAASGLHRGNTHDPEELTDAYDFQKTILSLICPSCRELPTGLPSNEKDFILSLSEAIYVYQYTQDVKGLFISETGLSPELDPYLILKISDIIRDEDLFARAMPHAVGQWFKSTPREDLPKHIETLVRSEMKKFEDLIYSAARRIERVLLGVHDICYIVAAHCLRQEFAINYRSIVHPSLETSWDLFSPLYYARSSGQILSQKKAMRQMELLDYIHTRPRKVEEPGHRCTYETVDLRSDSVKRATERLMKALNSILQPLFEDDQGLGYFTPVFHGQFPWNGDVASATDATSDISNGATGQGEANGSDKGSSMDESWETDEDSDEDLDVIQETTNPQTLVFRPRMAS